MRGRAWVRVRLSGRIGRARRGAAVVRAEQPPRVVAAGPRRKRGGRTDAPAQHLVSNGKKLTTPFRRVALLVTLQGSRWRVRRRRDVVVVRVRGKSGDHRRRRPPGGHSPPKVRAVARGPAQGSQGLARQAASHLTQGGRAREEPAGDPDAMHRRVRARPAHPRAVRRCGTRAMGLLPREAGARQDHRGRVHRQRRDER